MIQIFDKKEDAGLQTGNKMKELLHDFALENRISMIGPAGAGISKINDVYRFCLILKHKDKEVLKQAKRRLEQYLSTCEKEGKIVQFDFNPMSSF